MSSFAFRKSVVNLGSARTSVLLGALLAATGILKYGLNPWPSWENFFQIAQNWSNPTAGALVQPPQDYILSNALPTVLTGALGITSVPLYVSLQVVLTLIAIVIPFLMPSVRESKRTARLTFTMLAGGPTLALLLTGVGGYDALCVIGASIAVLARNLWVGALGWFIFAVCHSSLALIAFASWMIVIVVGRMFFSKKEVLTRSILGVLGLLSGFLLVWLVTSSWGGVTSRLEAFQLYGIDYYLNAYIAGMPMILFTALGVGWIVLLDRSVLRSRATSVLVVLSVIVSLMLPLITLDESRTVALVIMPSVLAWVSASRELYGDKVLDRLWSRYGVVAAIVPVILVWSGMLASSGLQSLFHWRANF
jgi:hypothetical protein